VVSLHDVRFAGVPIALAPAKVGGFGGFGGFGGYGIGKHYPAAQ